MSWIKDIECYVPQNPLEAAEQAAILQFTRQADNILLRENSIAHITVSGYVMNKTCTHVLMVYHNIYNSWSWTGGHADGNGDLFAVALQEVQEETGVTSLHAPTKQILDLEILPVWAHIKNGKTVATHLHLNAVYLLIADETQPLRIKPDENSGVKWLPADNLKDYVTEPRMLMLYDKLTTKARKIQNG